MAISDRADCGGGFGLTLRSRSRPSSVAVHAGVLIAELRVRPPIMMALVAPLGMIVGVSENVAIAIVVAMVLVMIGGGWW